MHKKIFLNEHISFINIFLILLLSILTIIPIVYQDDLISLSTRLLRKYSQEHFDLVLFFLTAISSSPIALPVWPFPVIGIVLGYPINKLIFLITIASVAGSTMTYFLGRYFNNRRFILRKFPKIHENKWTEGKSFWSITAVLFGGTALPLPVDILYAASGIKRYPVLSFLLTIFLARLIGYSILVHGWENIKRFLI